MLVTNGGKHAVYNTFQVLCDPGDEVLLPAPYWTSYPETIVLGGGVPVVLPTTEVDGFRVTVEQLEAARTPRTKALLFVSPSNPTGAVYPPAEVEAIGRWAAEHGIWVITDEIYEHLTYGDHVFSSMPTLVPEIADRCVILNGVAKTYAMTGWRVGWMIAPARRDRARPRTCSRTRRRTCRTSRRPPRSPRCSGDLEAVAEMRDAFARRGRMMYELLSGIPGVTCLEPQGAFYCFPSFVGVLGREIAGRTPHDTLELCELLLDVAKVAIVPGEAFGAPGYARLSFALGDDDLGEGVRRIADCSLDPDSGPRSAGSLERPWHPASSSANRSPPAASKR